MPEYRGEERLFGPTPEQVFDRENNVELPRRIAERIIKPFASRQELIDAVSRAIEDARWLGAKRAAVGYEARIAELESQLQAEGEHTAAANANIDRLNTEIERVTRRQQGPLMGKD